MQDEYSAPAESAALTPAELEAAKKKERTDIFVNASLLAILLLLYDLFNIVYFWLFHLAAYTAHTGSITFDIKVAMDKLSDITSTTAFTMTANNFIVGLSAVTIFIIGQFFMKIKLTDILKPSKGFVRDGAFYFPTTLTLNLMMSLIMAIVTSQLAEDGITIPEADFSMDKSSAYALIIQFVYICLLGPICEEFIYRGLCIKLLAPYGYGVAISFSAITFGMMHGNLKQAIPAMMSGVLYALITVKFKSIAPSIVMHIMNNIIASIGVYGDALDIKTDNIICAINIIALFLGFYGVIVMFTELIEKVYCDEPKCHNTLGRRFLSVWTNIFCVIYIFYLLRSIVDKIINANS